MNKNILFIDDDPIVVMVGKILIEGLGYNFKSADDGASGIEELKENKIDAILLDLMLPDITGLEVLKMIKSDHKYSNIPVIIQTGISDNKEIEKALKYGAEGILLKPYNKEDIHKELKKLFNNH